MCAKVNLAVFSQHPTGNEADLLREPGQEVTGTGAGFGPPLRDSGQTEIRKPPETRANWATNYWFHN